MPVTAPMTRRQVLRLAGAAVLAVSLGACSDDPTDESFWTRLAEAARREHPDLDAAAAERDLGASVTGVRIQAPEPALRRELHERIRADFAEGRTLLVTGWLLARTEVQLALVVAADR